MSTATEKPATKEPTWTRTQTRPTRPAIEFVNDTLSIPVTGSRSANLTFKRDEYSDAINFHLGQSIVSDDERFARTTDESELHLLRQFKTDFACIADDVFLAVAARIKQLESGAKCACQSPGLTDKEILDSI